MSTVIKKYATAIVDTSEVLNVSDLVIPDGMVVKVAGSGEFKVGNGIDAFRDLPTSKGEKGDQGIQGEQGVAGEQGPQGERGAPFQVKEIFTSIAAMEGAGEDPDKDWAVGDIVLINTGDVEDEDNAKLYVWDDTEFAFLADLSGAQGIQGPKGDDGADGVDGAAGQSAYELAVQKGFDGTEEEWLESLQAVVSVGAVTVAEFVNM